MGLTKPQLVAVLGGRVLDPGLVYLLRYAKIYYDFTLLTGANGSVITSVPDLSPNGINASNEAPAQNPVILTESIGANQVKSFKGLASSGTTLRDILISNTYGDNQFRSDFEVIFCGNISDSADTDFFGVANGTNDIRFKVQGARYWFEYRYSAATARRFVAQQTTGTVQNLTPSGVNLHRIRCDFTNHVFSYWLNGALQAMTSLVDAFNLIDPTKWANGVYKLALGAYNNSGTIVLYAPYNTMQRFAVTPLMTAQQAADVSNYIITL